MIKNGRKELKSEFLTFLGPRTENYHWLHALLSQLKISVLEPEK